MQQQVMVQFSIDIAVGNRADIGKITHHALIIQLGCRDRYSRLDAMTMQMAALAGMPHEPVAVAKVDVLGNGEHGRSL
jgi:hypothetical protein